MATFGASAALALKPLGALGVEITGLRLSQALEPETISTVQHVLADHGLVCFPDQPLSHDELEAFSLQIGPFGDNPFVEAMPGRPNLVEVRRDPGETTTVFGGGWHSDWSFQAAPPAATILHSKVTPPTGGDTLFADTAKAYDALSPQFQRNLRGLSALHSAAGPYGRDGYFAKESGRTGMRILVSADADRTYSHPLVTVHPISGRRSLFVSPGYTVGIEGMTEAESDAILGFLFKHITSESFVYRHVWRPDMLVIWDNRSMLHCATGGYDGHLRLMHRTVIAGGRPK